MQSILEVKKLEKTIKGKKILDNISFNLEKGEILGLVGKNGAGKSTLLKSLVGLSRPTKGEIKINGYDLQKEFELAIKDVGCVIEVPAMYDEMTGLENLKVFRMMFNNVSDEWLKEIIKLISLEESQYKKLKIYSLGMRQRLGLAVALLNKPKLLILDEPTNGLDPIGINDLRMFLKSLEDTSVIISSHILSEIENICDRVMFLDKGKIIEIKNLNKLSRKYKFYVDDCKKTKKLLSSYKVNDGMEIEVDANEIPKISDLLAKNNIKVFKVSETKTSLQDEFLKIIEEQQ